MKPHQTTAPHYKIGHMRLQHKATALNYKTRPRQTTPRQATRAGQAREVSGWSARKQRDSRGVARWPHLRGPRFSLSPSLLQPQCILRHPACVGVLGHPCAGRPGTAGGVWDVTRVHDVHVKGWLGEGRLQRMTVRRARTGSQVPPCRRRRRRRCRCR